MEGVCVMAKWGDFDFEDLKKLQKQVEQIEKGREEFCRKCANELAARLLRMVKKRTPVGIYNAKTVEFLAHLPERKVEFNTKSGKHVSFTAKAKVKKVKFTPKSSGKTGGTLRRGWTIGEIRHNGDLYEIEIINPIMYAQYVEYGHRTANHKGWVKGKFMLTISEQKIQEIAPALLEKKLNEYLRGCLDV